MDGRDTDPKSGKGFIEQVSKVCAENDAAIASIVGRFYAMDRDKRWERVKEAYDLLVKGEGKQSSDMVAAMQESYDEGVTDEFIKPIHNTAVNAGHEDDSRTAVLLHDTIRCFFHGCSYPLPERECRGHTGRISLSSGQEAVAYR